jgi:peptidoglycan/LPS O-acetylase OafA/YrhL
MFFGGACLFELRKASWMDRFFNSRGGAGASLALFMMALVLPLFVGNPSYFPPLAVPNYWGEPVRTAALLAGCSSFIACCILGGNFISGIMSFTYIRWLGNMSYSYYLTHALVVNGCAYMLHGMGVRKLTTAVFWILLPVLFAGSLIAAAALFLLVERPFSLTVKSPK